VEGDASGLRAIGSYLLWELEDTAGARPYLEAAAAGGSLEAALDLFVVAIFKIERAPAAARALPVTVFAV
jgi:hypothetical protein